MLLFGALTNFLVPLWLVGMGALLGLVVLGAIIGIVYAISRPNGLVLVDTVREGVLLPVFYLALFMAGFALLTTFVVPYRDLFKSALQLPFSGETNLTATVPADSGSYPVEIGVPADALREVELVSDRKLVLTAPAEAGGSQTARVVLEPDQSYRWTFGTFRKIFAGESGEFVAANAANQPAEITIRAVTAAEYPETATIPSTAMWLLILVGLYVVLRFAAPKISAVALATSKEAIAQPIFYVCLALGSFALLAFIYIPYNTFGEDVKMLKDSGLTLIMVLSILVALWTASVSVAEEIEGRTALTVLSKPVGRRQFVLGKFVGIIMPVALMFLLLGILFLATVSYKVMYDAKESSLQPPSWRQCHLEMISTVPGLLLAYLETVVLAAISVAISTRLPMLANLIICSSIYVLGHLLPMLVASSVGERFEIVQFVGQFFATILPVLDHFNVQAAVAAGAAVPLTYLGWALIYCLLYCSIAMLFALLMFEDRDLA